MDGDTINVWESKSLRDAWINHVKNTMVCEDRLLIISAAKKLLKLQNSTQKPELPYGKC